MLKKQKDKAIQVGFWQNKEEFQALWFDQHRQPHFIQSKAEEIHITPLQMAKKIAAESGNPHQTIRFHIVTAIQAKHIWSKTLILPHHLTANECEQQCRYILQQELPIPLEELWFDFCSKPLKQGFRLDIFAVMQKVAQQQVALFHPLKINVLDNLTHCLQRAFHYFYPTLDFTSTLLLYQDQDQSLAIQNKSQQLQLLQTQENLTALFEQFCQRYEENPGTILCYRTEKTELLPPDWQEIETNLPFIALGAALWQQDLTNETSN